MIIIDYSSIAVAGCTAISREIAKATPEDALMMIRHVILQSILGHKKRNSDKYGNVVIACDDAKYWRREYFPYYKASRKAARDKSAFNWDLVFSSMKQIREEIDMYFPYKVIRVDRCEADDIVACLAKEYSTAFNKQEPVLVVSADSDMHQLLKYDNVSVYSNSKKKQIKLSKKEVLEFLNEAIITGQGKKDGVPSILQNDDALVNVEGRAPSVMKSKILEFLDNGIDASKNELEHRNYIRNRTLIDFDYIPKDIYDSIIAEYEKDKEYKFDRMKLMNFFIKNKNRQLLNSLQDF